MYPCINLPALSRCRCMIYSVIFCSFYSACFCWPIPTNWNMYRMWQSTSLHLWPGTARKTYKYAKAKKSLAYIPGRPQFAEEMLAGRFDEKMARTSTCADIMTELSELFTTFFKLSINLINDFIYPARLSWIIRSPDYILNNINRRENTLSGRYWWKWWKREAKKA